MSAIGVVGLGAMGGRIAGRLIDAGYEVWGTNRTASRARPLVERGLKWMETPREVAAATEVLLSMVADDDALRAVSEGPDGILAGLAPGSVYVDMSTVSPQASRELAARVGALGAQMLDAPVSGSIPQAETGTLAIMVGGEPQALARVRPLLGALGQTITHIGPNGQGLMMKLAINISLAAQALAFGEGLLLAERGGVDRKLAAAVMSSSAIGSPMLKAREPLFLELPEQAWFDIALMHKDVRLARREAQRLSVPLHGAAACDEMLSRAEQLGYAHRDLAAVFEALRRSA